MSTSDIAPGENVKNNTALGKKSAWGTVKSEPTPSMEEIMSEEYARSLQEKEDQNAKLLEQKQENEEAFIPRSEEEFDINAFLEAEKEANDQNTSSDHLLALALQHEFNRQHDAQLEREEKHFNGSNKVEVSFENFRMVHPSMQHCESEVQPLEVEEEYDDDDSDLELDYNRGLAVHKNRIVSKHDSDISAKRNRNKVIDRMPCNVKVGDLNSKVSNSVYNNLKRFSASETKRSKRIHDKRDIATASQAMDDKTCLLIFKLENQGYVNGVNGAIATGKESVVFHANGGTNEGIPNELAVKVFKTTLTDFKNRSNYVKGDVRYFRDNSKKLSSRKMMKIWALKEDNNLRRMNHHGIPCPRVVKTKHHVLLMEFLGQNGIPAKTLKDYKFSAAEAELCFEQCRRNMRRMYEDCNLVHADLSPYNMLWFRERLYFIDVSQAVEKFHPNGKHFLLKDCENVCAFFNKIGVHNVPTPYSLFNEITDLNLEGEGSMFLQQLEQYEVTKDMLHYNEETTKKYPFEFFYNKAELEREGEQEFSSDSEEEDLTQDIETDFNKVPQECEEKDCTSEETSQLCKHNETDFNKVPQECEEIDCTTSEETIQLCKNKKTPED